MTIIYACDIHGDKTKYERLLKTAIFKNASCLVLCGDLLAQGGTDRYATQSQFVYTYLNDYFTRLAQNNIVCLFTPGNEDMETVDKDIAKMIAKHPNVRNIDNKKVSLKEVTFIGLSKIVDYTHRLKNRVVFDEKTSEMVNKTKNVLDSSFMLDVLKCLPKVDKDKKTIYVFHNPPYGIGLDVDKNYQAQGSKDVLSFLKSSNAYMSLHGYVHESPSKSDIWKVKLGNTIAIQPGQTEINSKRLIYVYIDTNTNECERVDN